MNSRRPRYCCIRYINRGLGGAITLVLLSCLVPPLIVTAASDSGTATQTQTGTVVGRIFNPATGEYVRNAEVRVQGTSLLVYSDADGTYRISNLPSGPLTL